VNRGAVALAADLSESIALTVNGGAEVLRDRVTALEREQDQIEDYLQAEQPRRDLFSVSDRQTVFALSAIPAAPHLVQLFLNGEKAVFGVDFMIDGVSLTWLCPILLNSEDTLELYY
jgi:hypothetical protein